MFYITTCELMTAFYIDFHAMSSSIDYFIPSQSIALKQFISDYL